MGGKKGDSRPGCDTGRLTELGRVFLLIRAEAVAGGGLQPRTSNRLDVTDRWSSGSGRRRSCLGRPSRLGYLLRPGTRGGVVVRQAGGVGVWDSRGRRARRPGERRGLLGGADHKFRLVGGDGRSKEHQQDGLSTPEKPKAKKKGTRRELSG